MYAFNPFPIPSYWMNHRSTPEKGHHHNSVSSNTDSLHAHRHRAKLQTFSAIDPHWPRMCSTEATYTNNFMHILHMHPRYTAWALRETRYQAFFDVTMSQLLQWPTYSSVPLLSGSKHVQIRRYNRWYVKQPNSACFCLVTFLCHCCA